MRVMVIVKATKESEAGVLPDEQLLSEMGKYNEELVKAGIMLAGEGLQPSSKGARVQFSGHKRTVIDGPFAETKELIAGFWMWQVSSMDEAIEWVKRCPNPMHGDEAEIEIRQVFEAEDSATRMTPELREQEERLRAQTAEQRRRRPRAKSRELAPPPRDGVIGGGDGYRHPSRHRRRLAHRIAEADRRPRANRPRHRRGRRSGARRARRGARAVASGRHAAQPRRMADGHGETPRDRPLAPKPAASSASTRRSARARSGASGAGAGPSTRPWTTTSATTCCGCSSRPAIRCCRPRRAWR